MAAPMRSPLSRRACATPMRPSARAMASSLAASAAACLKRRSASAASPDWRAWAARERRDFRASIIGGSDVWAKGGRKLRGYGAFAGAAYGVGIFEERATFVTWRWRDKGREASGDFFVGGVER